LFVKDHFISQCVWLLSYDIYLRICHLDGELVFFAIYVFV